MLVIIWIFGVIISLPQLFASRIVSFEYGGNKYLDCREEWDDKYNEKVWNLFYLINFCKLFLLQVFLLIIFLLTFVFPTIILLFTYGSILIALKRHITPGNADNIRDKAIFKTKVKVWINFWLYILSIDSDAHRFMSTKIFSYRDLIIE